MKKFAITVGETVNGKLVVLDGPTVDIGSLVDGITKLTNAGGKSGKGVAVHSAVILHSTKGVLKKRKDMPGTAKRAADVAAAAAPAETK